MMSETMTVEELRREGLRLYYANALEEALPYFERARSLTTDSETSDLLTIHAASVHVAMGRSTEEVQALPRIMMRRPQLRGLAAYQLAAKFENEKDYGRARFYTELALQAAEESEDARLEIVARIDLGNLNVYDSRPLDATEHYEAALRLIEAALAGGKAEEKEAQLWMAMATQNLGYCRLVLENPAEGVELIHAALGMMSLCGGEAWAPESYIDLCLGYLDLGRLEEARHWGELGLERATEDRQVRNAHYLLGEVAWKLGDIESATRHFETLSAFYPDFPQLRNLLFAIDLRKVVNFKL